MSVKIQFRKDTAANWTSANPTLLDGELGYETDTKSFKIGDGTTAWNSLSYNNPVTATSTNTLTDKSVSLASNTVTGTLAQFNAALTDADFATLAGTETLTNKVYSGGTLVSPKGALANMEVFTTGTSWSVPTELRVVGAKWKVTLVGGGGQGGGSNVTAGQVGGGGGSGGVVVGFFTYVDTVNSMTYSIGTGGTTGGTNANGQSGTDTTATYNAAVYTAGLGTGGTVNAGGGAGGTATGGTLNLPGAAGENGGVMAATSNYTGDGADTPLGYGMGGNMPVTAAGATGSAATGYGAGGSGGRNGTGTTARAGGAGSGGLLIIEY